MPGINGFDTLRPGILGALALGRDAASSVHSRFQAMLKARSARYQLVIGAIILIFWNRKQVKAQSGMFPVKIKAEAEPDAEKEPKWSRKGYAQWVHDVLIVRTGIGLMKATPYGISGVASPTYISSRG